MARRADRSEARLGHEIALAICDVSVAGKSSCHDAERRYRGTPRLSRRRPRQPDGTGSSSRPARAGWGPAGRTPILGAMKLARLWRPRHPLFWLMLLFNGLSSLCAWLMRLPGLGDGAILLLGLVALANVGFGLLTAWRLLQLE